MGVNRILVGPFTFDVIYWTFLVIIFTVITIFFITLTVIDYLKYETKTNVGGKLCLKYSIFIIRIDFTFEVGIFYNQSVLFPAITACNLNPLQRGKCTRFVINTPETIKWVKRLSEFINLFFIYMFQD